MQTIRVILFVALTLIILAESNAQSAPSPLPESNASMIASYYHALGMEWSSLTGYGILYRQRLSPVLSLKLTGVPYYREDNSRRNITYSLGTQVQWDATATMNTRGYFLVGGAYNYDNDEILSQGTGLKVSLRTKEFSVAIGVGGELRLYKKLTLHGELTSGFRSTKKEGGIKPAFERLLSLGMGIGASYIF